MQIIETRIDSIKELTAGLLNYADSFSFVVREDNEISQNVNNLISDLSIFLIEKKEVQEWPGTKLLLGFAKFYRFNLNAESAFILNVYENYLYKWVQPELPEDLIFYKQEQPVFISITHENDAYFELDIEGINIMNLHGLTINK